MRNRLADRFPFLELFDHLPFDANEHPKPPAHNLCYFQPKHSNRAVFRDVQMSSKLDSPGHPEAQIENNEERIDCSRIEHGGPETPRVASP